MFSIPTHQYFPSMQSFRAFLISTPTNRQQHSNIQIQKGVQALRKGIEKFSKMVFCFFFFLIKFPQHFRASVASQLSCKDNLPTFKSANKSYRTPIRSYLIGRNIISQIQTASSAVSSFVVAIKANHFFILPLFALYTDNKFVIAHTPYLSPACARQGVGEPLASVSP